MPQYITPTAVFDLYLDDSLIYNVEAESRAEANRLFTEAVEGYNTLAFQGRWRIDVREHEHEPSAGNISVCVFCQARIEPPKFA
jgi:hypothetical protein